MTALVNLFQAVQTDKREDIDAFLAALKLESANKRLAELSENYHFKTFWDAQAFDGNRVMLAQDLAHLMYGTRDISGLGQLLRGYNLALSTVGGSVDHLRTLMKFHFRLSRFTSQVSFATYQHFLMAGMKGETPLAQKVCAYLLAMEEKARVTESLQAQRPAEEILREGWLVHDKRIDGVEKGVQEAKAEAREAKIISINNQHEHLRLKKLVLQTNQNRLQHAQSYLPGEIQSRMRGLVFQFANFHCLRCTREMTFEADRPLSIEVDEVDPRGSGGNRTWDNVQALCRTCNQLKRDAALRGEFMGRWDFRTSTFHAACARELAAYNRRMLERENSWPLFPDEGMVG